MQRDISPTVHGSCIVSGLRKRNSASDRSDLSLIVFLSIHGHSDAFLSVLDACSSVCLSPCMWIYRDYVANINHDFKGSDLS